MSGRRGVARACRVCGQTVWMWDTTMAPACLSCRPEYQRRLYEMMRPIGPAPADQQGRGGA